MEDRKIIVDEPHHSIGSFDFAFDEQVTHAVVYPPRASTGGTWQLPAIDVIIQDCAVELQFPVATGASDAFDFSRFQEANSSVMLVECDDGIAISVYVNRHDRGKMSTYEPGVG
jgi:hypothetical protein